MRIWTLRIWRRLLILIVVVLSVLIVIVACTKKVEPTNSPTPSPTILDIPSPPVTPEPTPTPDATAELGQTVARYFPNIGGAPTLYGAFELKNTSTLPIIVKDVKVVFNTGEYKMDTEFTPMLNKDDSIEPGKTANFATWLPYEKEKDTLKADAPIKMSVEYTVEYHDNERPSKMLRVSNIRVTDNYPGFSTVSGEIQNTTPLDYSLSLVYVSFYDENDKLLATWHFTKNFSLPAEERRNFVVHMQTLPNAGLSRLTKRIESRCIGID